MSEKIISYSLWGNNPKYTTGAIKNIQLAKKYFPEWKVRIYLSTNTHLKIESENLEIVSRTEKESQDGCFWRFEACDSNDIVIVRDLDDRLSQRHRFVVDEWLASDLDIHIIKDHPNHTYPVMAGLWGCRNGILKGITDSIINWKNKTYYTCDQDFLRKVLINDKYLRNSYIHDSFRKNFGHEKTIKKERIDYEFLGDTFDEDDNRTKSYREIIQNFELKNKIE